MDHVPHSMEMQMRMVGHMSNNQEHQQFSVSNEHVGLVEQMSGNSGYNTLMIPINTVGHVGSSGANIGLSSSGMQNQRARENTVVPNNIAGYNLNTSLPVKRKAEMAPLANMSNSLPNKFPAQMGTNANWHLLPSGLQSRPGPAPPNSGSGVQVQSALNKKIASNESAHNKPVAQRGRPPKKQTTQIESATKSRPESSEAVRSKMRENLASAIAMATQKQGSILNSEKDHSDITNTQQLSRNTQAVQSNPALNGHDTGSGSQKVSKEIVVGAANDPKMYSSELPSNGISMDGGHTFQEFPYTSIFPDVDVPFSDNFFAKDDLLQGNGLSWAFDFDMQKREGEDQNVADKANQPTLKPEDLAFKIEAELFKLFGGVNKKYKEKGRSLLFNLKDRNNPELRERVMAGEIPPEKLCSMSAEELASKELSEWRMTKAVELAQMVVLPDTDGDMRRLVKKTHKGEYQVEFDRDDSIVEEVSGGTSMVTRLQPKKETASHSATKANLKDEENTSVQKSVSENQEFSGSLVIPTDGADLMQGMMVDEMKDAESLPPIVSLDEFMESLNSEPPFANLSADGLLKTSETHEEKSNVVKNTSAPALDSPKDDSSKEVDAVKKHDIDMTFKSSRSPKQSILSTVGVKEENIWEGALQLSVSSSVTVYCQFRSGEKTSVKEWPTSLEIKGRVRLEAFGKFLQELPLSRTRAVMVLQIDLKDNSPEKQLRDFSEAVESYSADERLGYAEPTPGVELYLCPPTSKMTEMLNKYLPKRRPLPEPSSSTENGLIGVVVWRRAHISSNISSSSSPSRNSSSHNKHSTKKQQYSSSTSAPNRMMQNSSSTTTSTTTNVNAVNAIATPSRLPSRPAFNNPSLSSLHHPPPPPEGDDDDDVPPGFGPGAIAAAARKDDDDLPEFNFSSHLNPPSQNMMLTPHVDQVRELIKKYGQSGGAAIVGGGGGASTLAGIEPWNDDDDDDIPEWRPEVGLGHRPNQQLPPRRPPPPAGSGGRWVQPPPHEGRWRPY
ncbi:uncharacterized protein LOC127243263 [Andrographis paniculata]|uniref:uncharacterized protein LOC127243263 n=1 Tax=Andrographis paniculata TaxID=175694 RepID=UPI0021E92ECE|nr:uncharacterized protein LOC127243263 [Andrographis paniculata]